VYRGLLIGPTEQRHGYLITEDLRFEESRIDFDEYIFTPTFFNSHTHLGDAALKEAPFMELRELVGPDGYKHEFLQKTDPESLRHFATLEVETARKSGTSHFLDFREGGITGYEVIQGLPGVLPLLRPNSLQEAKRMRTFGFSFSSIRDHNLEFLESIRKLAKNEGIIFALHAGEADCNDVDPALDLNPDLIIHMNFCPQKLKEVFDLRIPIVSCFRSNAFFGLLNPESYKLLKDYDLWLLGTDNAMIASPSILDELHFASYIVRDDESLFRAAIKGHELFNQRSGFIVFHRKYSFKKTRDPISTLVRRANSFDIELVLFGENN